MIINAVLITMIVAQVLGLLVTARDPKRAIDVVLFASVQVMGLAYVLAYLPK